MSVAYYHLYERKIKRKNDTEARVTEMVNSAYNAGLLTTTERDNLLDLITEVYGEE